MGYPAENAIRPLAVGRKNYLFAGNETGGQNLAILLSLATCCHDNGINFREWLDDVCRRLGTTKAAEIDTLLPHQWKPCQVASATECQTTNA